MHIAVIGTGNIGRTLGEALAAAGHDVRYGSRTPEESVREALDGAEAVIVGIPGDAVDGVVADLLYSADESDRKTVERLVRDIGLNPVYLGPGRHDLLDQLLHLWFTLVNTQGRGRHLAFKVL
ncbi:NAD(P)-binding domain-containing protein [Nonomuraea sp. LPB2021202275-12-8]|uniref:NAD(P)-binding domain-containing protein n=1 Tax=Nonomuraea sp. LPB2021202275-12-8 TaxID=3120159 RepID=UPI00300D9B14